MDDNKINWFFPIEIVKAVTDNGEGKRTAKKLRGIASTPDKDTDGEILLPEGFNLQTFMNSGVFNWHHQQKSNPLAVIGEPTFAKVNDDNHLEVECLLYDTPLANQVFELAEVLQKSSKTRRLGFSIEGQATERDPQNKKIITKANITGCAITYMPKNSQTWANIVKGGNPDSNVDLINELQELGINKADFSELLVSDEIEKSLDTSTGAALLPESLDGVTKILNKGQLILSISKRYSGINRNELIKAKDFILKYCDKMTEDRKLTMKNIEDAFAILEGFEKAVDSDSVTNPDYVLDEESGYYKKDGAWFMKADNDTGFEEIDREPVEIAKSIQSDILEPAATDFDRIEKALLDFNETNKEAFSAIGSILKQVTTDLNKAQEDNLSLSEQIGSLKAIIGDMPNIPTRRSFDSVKTIEKAFNGNIGNQTVGFTLNARRDKNKILELMDKKAYVGETVANEEFHKAISLYESSSFLPANIIESFKKDNIFID